MILKVMCQPMTVCMWEHATSWTTESDIFKKVCEVLVRAFSMIIQLIQLQALRRLVSNTRLSHCGFFYVVYLVIYDVSIRYLHRPW